MYLDDRWVYVETVPAGVTVVSLPENPERVVINGEVYYRSGSTFYVEKPVVQKPKDAEVAIAPAEYRSVKPPIGAMVDSLPEGAAPKKKNSVTYYRADDVYYLPIHVGEAEKYVVVAKPD